MDFSIYKTTLDYPSRPTKPILDKNANSKIATQFVKDLEKYESDMIEYQKKQDEYREESFRIKELFKKDALEDSGLSEHPNRNKIFNYAWEKGHSSGYSEVYYELMNLAELFY